MSEDRRLLARFKSATGEYPQTLAAALPAPQSQWLLDYERDAWGRAFRYARTADGYELRSAGADGKFGSNDDIVATPTLTTPPG